MRRLTRRFVNSVLLHRGLQRQQPGVRYFPGRRLRTCDKITRRAIFRFRRRANHLYKLARLTREEGRIAIVTKAGWDAVDAAALGVKRDGRAGFGLSQTRERSTARRRTMLLRTVKSCGSGTRCWCQVGGGMPARPGAGMPLIRQRR